MCMRPEAASLDSAYSWFAAVGALVIASISFGAVTSIPILLTPISIEMGLTRAELSFGHSLAMFGAGAGGLLMGRLLDKHGYFLIAICGGLATGGGLYLAGSVSKVWQLYCVYGLLIGAIGQGAFFSPLAAALSLWFDRYRALAISIASCGQAVGGLIAPPLLRMSAEHGGWRSTLQTFGIFAAACISILSLVFLRKPPDFMSKAFAPPIASDSSIPQEASLDSPARKWQFALCGVAFALSNLATFVVIGHITALGEDLGFSPMKSATLLSTFLGVTFVSRIGYGYLAVRWGKYPLLLTVTTMHVGGIAILAAAATYMEMTIGLVVIGISFGGYIPGYAVLVSDMFPKVQVGRRIGEIYLFAFVAAGLGSWLGGIIRDTTGSYVHAMQAALVISSVAVLVLYRGRRLFRRS